MEQVIPIKIVGHPFLWEEEMPFELEPVGLNLVLSNAHSLQKQVFEFWFLTYIFQQNTSFIILIFSPTYINLASSHTFFLPKFFITFTYFFVKIS